MRIENSWHLGCWVFLGAWACCLALFSMNVLTLAGAFYFLVATSLMLTRARRGGGGPERS